MIKGFKDWKWRSRTESLGVQKVRKIPDLRWYL
jgi:hypothetical protein